MKLGKNGEKKINKVLFLLFALIAFIIASPAFSLTWSEALIIADKNSNDIKSSLKEVESKEWSYRKALFTFLPNISLNANYSENLTDTPEVTSKSYSYGINITENLFKGMADIYAIKSSFANLEYQKAVLQSTKASVLYNLRSAFINVLVAQENVKLSELILNKRRENSKLIQLRYDSGREDKGNLMTTQADQASAEQDLEQAKSELKLTKLKLSQLLEAEIDKVEEPDRSLTLDNVSFEKLLRASPDYIGIEKQLEIAKLAQEETISGFLPSLSISGSWRKSDSKWPPEEENKSWSINLSYPLFNGGSNFADRAIAGANLDSAKEQYEKRIKDLIYSMEEAYENYKNSILTFKVSKISLSASEEREKITSIKYLNGLTTYDEWYRVENAYIQSQKNQLSAKKAALLAEALWNKTYGGWVK